MAVYFAEPSRLEHAKMSPLPTTDILISPRNRLSSWQALTFQNEEDWLTAVDIVEDRIKGRFVRWADKIVEERYSGFVVVALDCLLLETLVGFQEGHPTHKTRSAYVSLLTRSMHFSFDKDTALSFYENVRNGIIHDAETRRRWIIRRAEPRNKIIKKDAEGNLVLNRTMFHEALKAELDDWISRIRRGDIAAREKMRARMQEIIGVHFAE
jgi:hypothetical protein